MTPAGSDAVQSVERALSLLDVLAGSSRRLSLGEIAAAAGLPPSTAHRLLQTLAVRAFVQQDADRRYLLGSALLGLGNSAARLLAANAQPYLEEIADFSGETTNLALMEDDRIAYVAQAAGRHRMRMFTEIGRRVLPHSTAVGKVLLAWKPEDQARRVLGRFGLPQRTAHTITDVEGFLAELAKVRNRGFAVDDEEEEEGVRCIAVPVGPGAGAYSSISVSAPAGRMPDIPLPLIGYMTEVGAQLRSAGDSTI